jgi:NTE family protein
MTSFERRGEDAPTAGRPGDAPPSGAPPPTVLPSPSMFDDLDADARAALEREAEPVQLPAGHVLFEQGDAADALYVVLSGSLGVLVGDSSEGRNETGRLVNQIYAGQTVGEMALVSQRARSATVVASRDTSLLRITKDAFAKLVRTHSGAMLKMSAQLVDRLENATLRRNLVAAPRTLALVPVDPTAPAAWLAGAMTRTLIDGGAKTCVLNEPMDKSLLDRVEMAHDLTLYHCTADDPLWTSVAIDRADRIFFVASAATSASVPTVWRIGELPWRTAELIVVQREGARTPAATAELLGRLPVRRHWHIREGNDADVARLGRHVLGRAVGVVFSGGGARGYAHIGVVRALREIGVPLDVVGGASFGAIVAASVACEWDDHELLERFREAFARSNPLNDYAIPLVALTKGRKVSRQLHAYFGDRRIEDLWLPFFTVAANLTTGSLAILKDGLLWQALRASIALPGLMPPWIVDGEVFVDGAVMNNLPTDVMSAIEGGVVIAVDLTRYETLRAPSSARRHALWRILTGQEFEGPSIVSTLLRSAHVGSDVQTKLSRDIADVVLDPPLPDIDLRDWKALERAVEAGYRYAMGRTADLQRFALKPAAATATGAPRGGR